MLKVDSSISEDNSVQGIKGLGLHGHYVHLQYPIAVRMEDSQPFSTTQECVITSSIHTRFFGSGLSILCVNEQHAWARGYLAR